MKNNEVPAELLREVHQNNLEGAKKLLDEGADPNVAFNQITGLMLAAEKCNREMVQLLLGAGTDPNLTDSKGSTAIIDAINQKQVGIVSDLIKAGADVNANAYVDSNAPIHIAVWLDSPAKLEMIPMLLGAGADINIKNAGGNTPLILAANIGDKETVKLLLEAGADKNIKADDGNTALDLAKENAEKEVADLLEGKPEQPPEQEPARVTQRPAAKPVYQSDSRLKSMKWDTSGTEVKFLPEFIKSDYHNVPVFRSTYTQGLGKMAARKCVRCGEILPLETCPNCGSYGFVPGYTAQKTAGLFCQTCNTGFDFWDCPNCSTSNPISKSLVVEDKRMCFIATAALGSDSADEVIELCSFRDEVLQRYFPGRMFISIYYKISPPVARIISGSSMLMKLALMLIVRPAVGFVRLLRMMLF